MKELNTILIIAAIIQLVTLIVFFVMAYNVSEMKKWMGNKFTYDEYINKANEEKYIGNKAKAKEWLLRADYNLQKDFRERTSLTENPVAIKKLKEQNTSKRFEIHSLLKELEEGNKI